MTFSQQQLNYQQYHDKSAAYLHSRTHAEGPEFEFLRTLMQQYQVKHVLDVGCGGGHVSYQLAPVVEQVVAYDAVTTMAELVQREATRRGLHNIVTAVGRAEDLDFADGVFDAVVSRYSAHHWSNVAQAMQEMNRVLVAQGITVMIDIVGNTHPQLDTYLQTLETIRDPSHVRNYTIAEWIGFAQNSGFQIVNLYMQRLMLDFSEWVKRMQTPEHAIQTLRYLQQNSGSEFAQYYPLQADGSFSSDVMLLVLQKL